MLATGSPMDVDSRSKPDPVNTDRMLDVSVSIRTISHVTIDRYGDSVWSPGSGSGLMVSTANCEVWTNHHVIENAAVIEVLPRGLGSGAWYSRPGGQLVAAHRCGHPADVTL